MIKSYAKLKKQNKEKFKIPKSAQDTVPIDTIYKDGIFRMGNRYSKSYRFLDINYSIASKEEKMDLFLNYGELLNSFDSSMMVKITINNRKIDLKQFKEDILIPLQNDKLDFYRKEYNHMLLDKLAESDDIVQEKTFFFHRNTQIMFLCPLTAQEIEGPVFYGQEQKRFEGNGGVEPETPAV